MTDFTRSTTPEGVAILTWDVPGKSMNVMSNAGFAEVEALFDAALADPGVKGIVLTSAKKDFAGGMDLNTIAQMKAAGGDNPAQAVFDGVMAILVDRIKAIPGVLNVRSTTACLGCKSRSINV